MMLQMTRRRFLAAILAGSTSTHVGCGTILYPERRGQPHGRLDWGVVALDGLGLLLFFVPGVIAFAVDFMTGAIYLPPDTYSAIDRSNRKLTKVDVPRQELTRERIEGVVSAHTVEPITLAPGKYHSRELATLDDFWATRDHLATSVEPAQEG